MTSELLTIDGKRKYLTQDEQGRFLAAAADLDSAEVRTFCMTLAYTGCRISEALELTPEHIDLSAMAVRFRTLKQRGKDVYRLVPVPSPEDFIARLAALVPRPRVNLIRYHGVFAPSSSMRRAIVPTPANARRRRKRKDSAAAPATRQCAPTDSRSDCNDPPTAPLTWAQRLKRVFDIDITLCPLCGGQLRVIADITDPDLIRKILDHVQKRAPPRLPPRRAQPDATYPDLFGKRQ